jgi:hypothetical protein
MTRQKKTKEIQVEKNPEVPMSQAPTLEVLETEIDKARLELENVKRETEEKKLILKAMPGREVSEDEMVIVKKQVTMSSEKLALKAKVEKQRMFDNEKVTGKFINRRAPGQSVKLTYIKYETDDPKWYTFEDGKVYTIAKGFAEQINEHYYTPHFVQKAGEPMDPSRPSSAINDVDTSNKKYAFVPTNF